MVDTNAKLIEAMEKACHALMVHVGGLVTKEILGCCLRLVDKGIALELFLDIDNKLFLEENPFILNNCFQLANRGGSIFLVSTKALSRSWECILDFDEVSYFSPLDGKVINEKAQDVRVFQRTLLDFERRKQEAIPYLVEKGDIQIRFSVSDLLIITGDSVELSWEVDGADKVVIQGLGEVQAYGRKRIFPSKDTIIKIGASNERQSQIKAALVRVAEGDMQILYDIEFTRAGTNQYQSLVNSTIYPHVYGVSQGNLVKLTWKVAQATSVKVMPCNITEPAGEYIFTLSASLTIEIQATITNRTFIRKIQVLLFPISLFKEKLISPSHFIVKKYHHTAPGISIKKTEEILATEKQRYIELTRKVKTYYWTIGSKKINLTSLHAFLFTILKGRHSHRVEIVDELKAIQTYYDQPIPGKGTAKNFL